MNSRPTVSEQPAVEGPAARPKRFRALRAARERARRLPGGAMAWRAGIALLGLLIVVVGIALLALPGPGWVIIFVGLGVWSTEFEWAERLLAFARSRVERWTYWLIAQPRIVQGAIGAAALVLLAVVALAGWWTVRRL